jgi:hypothetical protein
MEKRNHVFWEVIGYITLTGLVIGQITIGYWYLFAQCIYLVCNIANVIRDFVQKMPTSYKVKDCFFTAITIGLIIIWVIK